MTTPGINDSLTSQISAHTADGSEHADSHIAPEVMPLGYALMFREGNYYWLRYDGTDHGSYSNKSLAKKYAIDDFLDQYSSNNNGPPDIGD